ncbi:hypothetical protein BV379_04435 [Rhodovulum sulfidophilum]|nr:hypothetical protein BV379_04435 [Rhodovulum sulfidophilum]
MQYRQGHGVDSLAEVARGFGAENTLQALGAWAVASLGDYRHWFDLGGRRLSHIMNQRRRAPLADSPASVSRCWRGAAVEADARAATGAFGALSRA